MVADSPLAFARSTVTAMLGVLLSFSSTLQALPEDRNQAIEIEAREALRDESKGLTVYEGNVSIIQGSIRINADRVSVYSDGSKVSRIVCDGRPASYQQQQKADAVPVIARANTITYDLAGDIILLTGNASLEQDSAALSGQRIEYDLKQEIIRAGGGDGKNDRIRMVIPPNQQGSN